MIFFFKLSLYVLKFFFVNIEYQMVKLDILKFYCVIHSEAWIVLSLFLTFGDFEPRCSYKIVLIRR